MVRDQWRRLAQGRTGVKLVGEALIRAERELVWQAINDPDILRQCIPGCEEITRETPVDWVATVVTRVGPVKARFNGRIRLEDLQAPESCRIVGEGSGGAAGFAGRQLVHREPLVGSARLAAGDEGAEIQHRQGYAQAVESKVHGRLPCEQPGRCARPCLPPRVRGEELVTSDTAPG